jgi:5-methylcytosine-specific restriction endonuclease McrA
MSAKKGPDKFPHKAHDRQRTITRLLARNGFLCPFCSETLDRSLRHPHPFSITIDHIQPVSQGGTDHEKNLQLAHDVCNKLRGTKDAYGSWRR